jgi:hypothetical protein
VRRRLSSADDADQKLIIGIGVGVNYDQDRNAPYNTDRMPPLLAVLEPVRDYQMKRIVPDNRAVSKSTPCLTRFDRDLTASQMELHQSVAYKIVRTISGGVKLKLVTS